MDELKEKLYESIEKNGFTSPATIKLSEELDEVIVMEQRETYGTY